MMQLRNQNFADRAGAGVLAALCFAMLAGGAAPGTAQPSPLPAGVQRICSIRFDADKKFPARVEDSAVPCLEKAVRSLKAHPTQKLVLIGAGDLKQDSETVKNGQMRETEDNTGADVRFEDLAAYRALNTKGYLVRFYGISPERILPTTNEWVDGQYVNFYLVPGDAGFNHNYLDTTKINENPCTVKPCYSPDEETLTAQPRARIVPPGK